MAKKKETIGASQLSLLFEQEIDKEFPERKEDKVFAKALKNVFSKIMNKKIEDSQETLDTIRAELAAELGAKNDVVNKKKDSFADEVTKRKSSGRILGSDNIGFQIMKNMHGYIAEDPGNAAKYKLNAKKLFDALGKEIDEDAFGEVK